MKLFPRSFGAEEAYKIQGLAFEVYKEIGEPLTIMPKNTKRKIAMQFSIRQKLPVAPGQAGQVTSKMYLFLCLSRFSLSLNIVFTIPSWNRG
jgi:hypothetical protein